MMPTVMSPAGLSPGLGDLGMDTGVELTTSPAVVLVAPPPATAPPSKKRAKIELPDLCPPPAVKVPSMDYEVHEMAARAAALSAAQALKREHSLEMEMPDSAKSASSKAEEEKQRRIYRVGLSYRCGRCGKPKKGHVCDVPDNEDGSVPVFGDGMSLSPQPAILATTVRKGTPPALLGSPLGQSPHLRIPMEGSPLGDVKISGESSTIFKDMVAALGENSGSLSLSPTCSQTSPGGGATPQIATAAGISPLAVSAIAAGSVSVHASCAAAVPLATAPIAAPAGTGGEPQLSEMDMMLADLAFAARPPPVLTPDEGADSVQNGLGSLSPSNFSPGTMIQQLIAAPAATNWAAAVGMDASIFAPLPQVASVRRATVVAQPTPT